IASDPRRRDVDVAKLRFKPVWLKIVPRRSKRIGLDDVRASGNVFVVHLADKVWSSQVQLIIAAVNVNAFVVKARSHGTVEDINAVRIQKLTEVFHIFNRFESLL